MSAQAATTQPLRTQRIEESQRAKTGHLRTNIYELYCEFIRVVNEHFSRSHIPISEEEFREEMSILPIESYYAFLKFLGLCEPRNATKIPAIQIALRNDHDETWRKVDPDFFEDLWNSFFPPKV